VSMHPLVRLLVPLALVTVLGCPLDIQVREEDPDEGPRACVKDQECPEGQRCDDASRDNHCIEGPRVTQPCTGFGTCSYLAFCQKGRCVEGCLGGATCRLGYQCAPDDECVEACTEGPPTKAGSYCGSSTDCGRCGFCVALGGGGKQCHQPCTADAECPGGAPGACMVVPGSTARVCRPE
jgi:hypothetical protein